jgi:mannose-6-phosphate isomerase-like protein (cupin superfamily)
MTATPTSSTHLIRHTEGETHAVMGDPMRFVVTGQHTGGAYDFCEQVVRPGNGAPPHIHHNEDESFYILEGSFLVTADGKEQTLSPGDFVHVPRGVVRSFTNIGDTDGRILIHHCPGAAAGFYIAMGQLPFPPDMKDIKALGDQYNIEIVMPEA